MRYPSIALLIGAAALAGCATRPENIAATQMSSSAYSGWTCPALAAETARVTTSLERFSAAQYDKAASDAAIVTAAIILLPLAAAATSAGLGPDGYEGEIAALKGQEAALRQASAAQGCTQ